MLVIDSWGRLTDITEQEENKTAPVQERITELRTIVTNTGATVLQVKWEKEKYHYVVVGTARKEENTVEKLLDILTADSGDAMDAEALSIMYKTKYGREITVRTVGNCIPVLKRHPSVRQLDGTGKKGIAKLSIKRVEVMFERYTQEARRAIFFARYEAGNYGSPYIETEHLLLGLLREDQASAKWFPGESSVEPQIRSEIEKRITRGNRISSVEIPLAADCKQVLNLAVETSERLGHRLVEPEHIMIGILGVEASLAAQILIARGVKPGSIQEHLAKEPSPNALAGLSQSEKEIVLQCMKAIADDPEIEDWEFHPRLGIDRPTLRRIISVWPEINGGTECSDEFLAVNNCLNEVCNEFDIPPTEWGKWFTSSKDEITQTYAKWLRLRGGHSGGVR